ncbi:MAG: class I SAM-dependent RNA methyltransferase [Pseudomonadota bacterium]
MNTPNSFTIFVSTFPGLESLLREEVASLLSRIGKKGVKTVPGGVVLQGGWSEVWRLNLMCRGATRVLVRIGEFPATHLAQLDKRARTLVWGEFLPKGAPIQMEASCRKSKIYHSGAAAERIQHAARKVLGAPDPTLETHSVFVRLDRDMCTVSLDTSGELLHKRGFKQAVAKAPLRETQAALFLRACGYQPGEPFVDPMSGSGTLVIEAAEMALGLAPGRTRCFAFEHLPSFDADEWERLKTTVPKPRPVPEYPLLGFDRDGGAVKASQENAQRAGLNATMKFAQQDITKLTRPDTPPGLVIINPPYGVRVGDVGALKNLYRTIGSRLRAEFHGWRIGLVTSEATLAHATGLPFAPPGPPIPHGSLRIQLYQTEALPHSSSP